MKKGQYITLLIETIHANGVIESRNLSARIVGVNGSTFDAKDEDGYIQLVDHDARDEDGNYVITIRQ